MHRRPRSNPRPKTSIGFALIAALALLVGCSTPVATIQLLLGDSSVVLIRGGSVDVALTLTRSGGASGPVSLSATGLPANVTATFAPPTLDGATTASILTLSATAAAVEASTSVAVTASSGALSDDASLMLDVESLAIAGRVVGALGLPIFGVAVASQGATSFTGIDGTFELEGLARPYDLVASAAFGPGAVQVFEGLTTATPVVSPVFAFSVPFPTPETAMVSGDVLGGAAVAVDRVVILCAEGLDLMVLGCDFVPPGDTAYALEAAWFGPTTATVRVHALHVEFAPDDTPAAYLGYEAFDLTISDGGADVRDLALAPVASVLLEGTVTPAAGMVIAGALGGVRFGPRLTMPLFESMAVGADVSVLVPAPAGASYDLTVVANGPVGATFAWTVDTGSDLGSWAVPAPVAQGMPVDAALGVDLATPFTSIGPDQVRTYQFSSAAGPTLAITTTRDSVTVPDPALGGYAFPAGTTYSWTVFGHGSTDPDAALSRSLLDYYDLLALSDAGGPGYDQDGSFTLAPDRDFTFAP